MDNGIEREQIRKLDLAQIGVKTGDRFTDPAEIATVVQVTVEAGNFESGLPQDACHDRSDIPAMACDQYSHVPDILRVANSESDTFDSLFAVPYYRLCRSKRLTRKCTDTSTWP